MTEVRNMRFKPALMWHHSQVRMRNTWKNGSLCSREFCRKLFIIGPHQVHNILYCLVLNLPRVHQTGGLQAQKWYWKPLIRISHKCEHLNKSAGIIGWLDGRMFTFICSPSSHHLYFQLTGDPPTYPKEKLLAFTNSFFSMGNAKNFFTFVSTFFTCISILAHWSVIHCTWKWFVSSVLTLNLYNNYFLSTLLWILHVLRLLSALGALFGDRRRLLKWTGTQADWLVCRTNLMLRLTHYVLKWDTSIYVS